MACEMLQQLKHMVKDFEEKFIQDNFTDECRSDQKICQSDYKQGQTDYKICQSDYKIYQPDLKICQSDYNIGQSNHKICQSNYKICQSDHKVCQSDYKICQSDHKVCQSDHKICKSNHKICQSDYKISQSNHKICQSDHKICQPNLNKCQSDQIYPCNQQPKNSHEPCPYKKRTTPVRPPSELTEETLKYFESMPKVVNGTLCEFTKWRSNDSFIITKPFKKSNTKINLAIRNGIENGMTITGEKPISSEYCSPLPRPVATSELPEPTWLNNYNKGCYRETPVYKKGLDLSNRPGADKGTTLGGESPIDTESCRQKAIDKLFDQSGLPPEPIFYNNYNKDYRPKTSLNPPRFDWSTRPNAKEGVTLTGESPVESEYCHKRKNKITWDECAEPSFYNNYNKKWNARDPVSKGKVDLSTRRDVEKGMTIIGDPPIDCKLFYPKDNKPKYSEKEKGPPAVFYNYYNEDFRGKPVERSEKLDLSRRRGADAGVTIFGDSPISSEYCNPEEPAPKEVHSLSNLYDPHATFLNNYNINWKDGPPKSKQKLDLSSRDNIQNGMTITGNSPINDEFCRKNSPNWGPGCAVGTFYNNYNVDYRRKNSGLPVEKRIDLTNRIGIEKGTTVVGRSPLCEDYKRKKPKVEKKCLE